ncbi:Uncharacterised protein [Mycobacterium tuberculosis]|nr:Uncharacterised protein [Mycobacterium tuberculosis]
MLKATAPPARMAAAIPAKIQRWCLLRRWVRASCRACGRLATTSWAAVSS